MHGMFSGCKTLKYFDLKNFSTSSVVEMFGLFKGCSSLISLDLSNFNISKVIIMNGMFNGCSQVTYISFMFIYFGSLVSIN